MAKSKKATLVIGSIILIFGLLGNLKLIVDINIMYNLIINPIFWMLLSIFLGIFLPKDYNNKKNRNIIIQYTIIATLIYIIVYMSSGLITTFGNNPYDTSLRGIIYNLVQFGIILVCKEYVRWKLINNVYDKDKILIAVIISAIYILIEFNYNMLINLDKNMFLFVKYILQFLLPSIIRNILFSYIDISSDCISSIIYVLGTNLYLWIIPILPNMPWVMTVIIDITIPLILILYIRYIQNKYNRFRSKENIINSNPKSVIPFAIIIILITWTAAGIFPIKPVAIASGSMEPKYNVGDIVFIKKCNANDINVGDVIEYKMDGYTVIHRVIEKTRKSNNYYFITKGDNNKVPDNFKVIDDQLIGKVIFKIRYLGLPSIWIHGIERESKMKNIEVET